MRTVLAYPKNVHIGGLCAVMVRQVLEVKMLDQRLEGAPSRPGGVARVGVRVVILEYGKFGFVGVGVVDGVTEVDEVED
jgi:hypothetical protein